MIPNTTRKHTNAIPSDSKYALPRLRDRLLAARAVGMSVHFQRSDC
jgi:hypothetical protein